jgi:hypothetical protein
MSYPARFRFIEGIATLKILVQSLEIGEDFYWDDVGMAWVDGSVAIPANCYKTLAESSSPDKGVYTATFTNLSPVKGCAYRFTVVDSAPGYEGFYHISDEVFPADTDTAKTIVNAVQERLRLPQSSDFTDSHAKLVLKFVNDVYLSILPNAGILQQLRSFGRFTTYNPGAKIYPILPVNKQSVERLVSLKPYNLSQTIDPGTLEYLSPEELRAKKEELGKDYDGTRPIYYTIKQTPQRFPVVEFFPGSDEFYPFEFEVLLKPEKLSATTDVPVVNSDLLIYGATALAKRDAGLDPAMESELFLQLLDTTFKNSDFEPSEISC